MTREICNYSLLLMTPMPPWPLQMTPLPDVQKEKAEPSTWLCERPLSIIQDEESIHEKADRSDGIKWWNGATMPFCWAFTTRLKEMVKTIELLFLRLGLNEMTTSQPVPRVMHCQRIKQGIFHHRLFWKRTKESVQSSYHTAGRILLHSNKALVWWSLDVSGSLHMHDWRTLWVLISGMQN